MFQGEFVHKLDQKNRIVLPSKFRLFISDEQKHGFFLTVTPLKEERCIRLYTNQEWLKITGNIKEKAYESDDMDVILRAFSARSEFAEIDTQHRVVIPQRLIDYAALEKKKTVILVGCINHIQVWNQDEWNKVTLKSDLQLKRSGIRMRDIYGI